MPTANNLPSQISGHADSGITPDLVQKVAEKVYALWLQESQIERERQRGIAGRSKRSK